MPIHLGAERLHRGRGADLQRIKRQQLPDQDIDKQARNPIAIGYPLDFTINTQPQKSLRRHLDASYRVYIRPSHELHRAQFLLFWGCYTTSTTRGEDYNFKELSSGT